MYAHRATSLLATLGFVSLGGCHGPFAPNATAPNSAIAAVGAGADSATVWVSGFAFTSAHNRTSNPAVDTVMVGGTVTWLWLDDGPSYVVRSEGSPTFASSPTFNQDGSTYQTTFTVPGTYVYDCPIQGGMMTGQIVVQ
jgi:plastocyanin